MVVQISPLLLIKPTLENISLHESQMGLLTPFGIRLTHIVIAVLDQDSFSSWEGFYGMSNREEIVLTISKFTPKRGKINKAQS